MKCGSHKLSRYCVNSFTNLSNLEQIKGFRASSRDAELHPSGAAEPDRHLLAVDDHRHRAPSLAVGQHALQLRRVLFDVDVLERNMPPIKIFPGGLCVGSGVFAEDVDHVPIVRRPDRNQLKLQWESDADRFAIGCASDGDLLPT
jgi:hypothetical protein